MVISSLEFIDLYFSDYGIYLCMVFFLGVFVFDFSVEVNIFFEIVLFIISVFKGRVVVIVCEGFFVEL